MRSFHFTFPVGAAWRRLASWGLLAGLALWAIVSLVRTEKQALSPDGSNDLYSFWRAGLLIRQQQDPYQAFLSGRGPALPIHFLCGVATSAKEITRPGLVPAPSNTFPLLFLITGLAFLPWPVAQAVWLAINLALAAFIPLLAMRLLPPGQRLNEHRCSPLYWGLIVLCLCLTATRYAASSGQTTFAILALMLGAALLAERHPILAGLLLGLALSKYSLAIGFWLYYLLLERRPRLALTALLVQVLGVLGLALWSGSAVGDVLAGYIGLFAHHAGMEGVHLAALFPDWGVTGSIAIAAGLTLLTFVPLLAWHWPLRRVPTSSSRLASLSALALWAMLAAYHRSYDAVVIILFFVLVASACTHPGAWSLSTAARRGLALLTLLAALVLIVPAGSQARAFTAGALDGQWVTLTVRATTWILLGGLVVSVWLLFSCQNSLFASPKDELQSE